MNRFLLAFSIVATTALAAEADKSRYHLFNPVPRELMRELAADRPDVTESPITVDAGHVQIEMSFVEYSHDDEDTLTFAATNIKLGLLNNVDIQFVFDAYTEEETRLATGGSERLRGFSDVQVRLKINLWGNDGGRTAFALFPFIEIPTGTELSDGHVEGGLILPFSVELRRGVDLGLMAEVDFVTADSGGHEAVFVHTAALAVELTERLGTFLEYIGVVGSGSDVAYQASLAGGLTYAINDDVQLDAGARVGLNEAAEDVGLIAGITARF